MGIIDSIKEKADELDKTYNPLRQAAEAMNPSTPKSTATPDITNKDEGSTVAPRGTPEANREIWNRGAVKNVGEPIKTESF